MYVVSQAEMRPYVLEFPKMSLAERFGAVAGRMLAWAGVSPNDPSRDRARAIVGWFTAHAVHPQPFLHPNGTTLNLGALPSGETWASFNAIFGVGTRTDSDNAYWFGLFPDGIAMIQRLIGTVAINGAVTDNGMLTEFSPGQWRIRNFTDFRSVQCTHQCKMAQVILASLGILAFDISTVGHDPMAYYDIENGKWFYIDPTFGEMLSVGGEDATPLDLLTTSLAGDWPTIVSEKLPGADYIPVSYFAQPNTPPDGMSLMTIHTNPQWAGGLSFRAPYRFGDLPSQSAANDLKGTIDELMPVIGAGVAGLERIGATTEVRLRSNWPEHSGFQRSLDAGSTWASCSDVDYLTGQTGDIRYRSVSTESFPGSVAILDI